MHPALIWMIVGLGLLIIEMMVGAFFLMWIGAGRAAHGAAGRHRARRLGAGLVLRAGLGGVAAGDAAAGPQHARPGHRGLQRGQPHGRRGHRHPGH